ncbi:MAG: hypothetical protein JWN07_308 [Hyphomicrobiales bacterium]|nr:hypothetical protein [Hyphomicrobiales bacterium]
MTPILLAGPAVEPLGLDETRLWLRLDSSDDDQLVLALIRAARSAVEQATRRALVAQSWRLRVDRWPVERRLRLPLSPILSLDAVRVFDAAGAPTLADLAGFHIEPARGATLVCDAPPLSPGRIANGIEIDMTAGFGASAQDVPEPLRMAMRLLVAHWYERRGDALHEDRIYTLPAGVAALVTPWRAARLA